MAKGWIKDDEWYPCPTFTSAAESDMAQYWGEPIEVPDEIIEMRRIAEEHLDRAFRALREVAKAAGRET